MKPETITHPLGDNPPSAKLFYGFDAIEALEQVPDESIQCVVTSPPYWGLRDYGVGKQVGLEPKPGIYIDHLVAIFEEIRRVLRPDGTLWLNIGDSYARTGGDRTGGKGGGRHWDDREKNFDNAANRYAKDIGLKPKDLVGIPWMLAFALRDAGWYLRQEIIWQKPNPMPEQTKDRCTKAHEQIFLLSKSQMYFFDGEAIKEEGVSSTRMKRSVWTVPVKSYKGAHFATFPPDLIEPCIKASTSSKGACSGCGAPYERVVGSEIDDLDSIEPIQRRGVLLTPEDSAIVHLAEIRGFDYRISVEGDKHQHLWEEHVVKGGRTGHFKTNGYSLIWWGEEKKTLGWEPTCDCKGGIKPCVVLDPFSGSATVGEVSMKLGRNYIGIDLNPEYLELAKSRLLGKQPPKVGKKTEGDILDLFGGTDDET
jgi:site-specific DNA-methyltransferase (adenine-specific)